MKNLVSVVIPNFNGEDSLRDCLDSVLTQTHRSIEIIVVDDCSTDKSLEVLKCEDYRNVSVVGLGRNMGVSVARNIGISLATGKYIAFLDNDDRWSPLKIEKQVEELLRTSTQINYCNALIINEVGDKFLNSIQSNTGNIIKEFELNPTRAVLAFGGSSVLFEKELVNQSGLLDPTMKGPSEDWDFFRRICKFGRVSYIDEPLVEYNRSSNGLSSATIDLYFFENRYAIRKLIEEENYMLWKRLRIWIKFYEHYIITLIKVGQVDPKHVYYKAILISKSLRHSKYNYRLARWRCARKFHNLASFLPAKTFE